jgi:nitrous oxidase accessory protein NosD
MRLTALTLAALVLPVAALANVDTILADAAKSCAEMESGVFASEGAVKEIDLTGDGTPDTVVDEALFTCSTSASLFNGGTGGSMVHFIVGDAETSYLVKGYDTADWGGRRIVLMSLHGTECNATGAEACFEALTWGGQGFLSVRPRPE